MARRMRKNGGQWKVLLCTRMVNGRTVAAAWRSDGTILSTVKAVYSFDEAMRCAISHFEGTHYDSAILLDPSGFPVGLLFGGVDGDPAIPEGQMRLFTFDEHRLLDGISGTAGIAFGSNLRAYHRSSDGWSGDIASRWSRLWRLHFFYMGERDYTEASPWPYAQVGVGVFAGRDEGGWCSESDARDRWESETRGVLGTLVEEDQ